MRNADTIVPDITGAIRWIARVGGIILVLFVAVVFFEEGREIKLSYMRPADWAMNISLLVAILGLLLGWVWEGLGGAFTIAGLLIFSIVNYYSGGDFPWELWVLGVPAALFIIYWWRTA